MIYKIRVKPTKFKVVLGLNRLSFNSLSFSECNGKLFKILPQPTIKMFGMGRINIISIVIVLFLLKFFIFSLLQLLERLLFLKRVTSYIEILFTTNLYPKIKF